VLSAKGKQECVTKIPALRLPSLYGILRYRTGHDAVQRSIRLGKPHHMYVIRTTRDDIGYYDLEEVIGKE
jgi:hypothetical protein